jgi:hypothetical protein
VEQRVPLDVVLALDDRLEEAAVAHVEEDARAAEEERDGVELRPRQVTEGESDQDRSRTGLVDSEAEFVFVEDADDVPEAVEIDLAVRALAAGRSDPELPLVSAVLWDGVYAALR